MSRFVSLPCGALVAALAIAVAGCGSDAASKTSPPVAAANSSAATAEASTPAASTPVNAAPPTSLATQPEGTAAPGSGTAALQHLALVRKLDAICMTGNAKASNIKTSGKTQAEQLRAAIPTLTPTLDAIRGLKAPPQDQAALASYRQSVSHEVVLLTQIAGALATHNTGLRTQLNNELATASQQKLVAATQLGARDCGQG